MKKSDALGASATFDAVSQPISSRAASFARYAGQGDDPAPVSGVEAHATSPRLAVTQLAHNPFNPREELKAVEDMADSLTARGIIQPLTVVTRAAFLSAHPGHDTELGSATHVVVDGNRRLAGANLAGLDDVPVHIDNSLAESADTLLETALTAAIQHESLDPLDEAKALERLVEVHGSQRAVARALGKSSPWVTQRLALLKLTPDLQQAVEDKSLPVAVARTVGQLPPQQQQRAADEALTARAERQQRRRGQGANAVSTSAPREPATGAPSATDGDEQSNEARSTTTDVDLPTPRKAVVKMPWLDGEKVADIVIEKMGEEQREVLLQRLIAARTVSGA
ncbi:ParB/RepB/Spo0J family partition protein [Streptomyces sp. NPDC056255]|uniref:ParB/RepB/Spo0J family partition protein n=1 Tax=Streptomyces sp. NPDC056255 TaxID=3345764 RepID=UPI0035E3129F